LARSDLSRAEALFQEGLRELPAEPAFVLDRISCLLSGSAVAREGDAPQKAIARSQAARDLLATSPLRSEITDLRVQMAVAESYRTAGQYRNALPAFEQVSALMATLGRDDTETAGTVFNNWALTLHASGRPLEAEKLFRRAIDIGRADEQEEGVSPMLMINYARTLRELGRRDEAADYAERGYGKAQLAGNQVVINQSLLLRARIYRDEGKLDLTAAVLAEVEPRLSKGLPSGHIAFAVLATEQSLLAQALGDLQSALRFAQQAVSIAEAAVKSGQQDEDYLPVFLVPRSDIERQLGRVDDAVADATRAVDLLQKAVEPGTFTNSLGHAYYTLGLALQAQGKSQEARDAFRSAALHLQNTLGADHADTRNARHMAEL
jgi:tetratricopeptide (TPR) repeat protein